MAIVQFPLEGATCLGCGMDRRFDCLDNQYIRLQTCLHPPASFYMPPLFRNTRLKCAEV